MQIDDRIDLLAHEANTAPTADASQSQGSQSSQSSQSKEGCSILCLAAASYGARPSRDATVPTGFDPATVALFEALVEGAYLVANADGVFDEDERRVFERVVAASCGGKVTPDQITALVADLHDRMRNDGMELRIAAIATAATKRAQACEILRIAALLAQASNDVSDSERAMLDRIATACGLSALDVDSALAGVRILLDGK
jgi:tellurite resistance protein